MKKILITGDSKLKIELNLNQYTSENIETIYISKENISEEKLQNTFEMTGMFFSEKNVVVKDFSSINIKQKNMLLKYFEEDYTHIINLIIISEKESKELKKIKFDEKKIFELPKPWEEEKWENYIIEIADTINIKLEKDVPSYLLKILGKNDKYIYQELQKLSIYCDGKVTYNDVVEISLHIEKPELEDLCYYISTKNHKDTLELFNTLTAEKDFNYIGITSYMFNYYLDLYKVITFSQKEAKANWNTVKSISGKIKVSSTRVRGFLGVSFKNDSIKKVNHDRLYEKEEVQEILIEIEQIDRKIKVGETPKILFLNLFSKICMKNV